MIISENNFFYTHSAAVSNGEKRWFLVVLGIIYIYSNIGMLCMYVLCVCSMYYYFFMMGGLKEFCIKIKDSVKIAELSDSFSIFSTYYT